MQPITNTRKYAEMLILCMYEPAYLQAWIISISFCELHGLDIAVLYYVSSPYILVQVPFIQWNYLYIYIYIDRCMRIPPIHIVVYIYTSEYMQISMTMYEPAYLHADILYRYSDYGCSMRSATDICIIVLYILLRIRKYTFRISELQMDQWIYWMFGV